MIMVALRRCELHWVPNLTIIAQYRLIYVVRDRRQLPYDSASDYSNVLTVDYFKLKVGYLL